MIEIEYDNNGIIAMGTSEILFQLIIAG